MNSQQTNNFQSVLYRLHKDAQQDPFRLKKSAAQSAFNPYSPEHFQELYLPISKEQGEFLQQLIIENNCKYIIEFGTSFGISTIYLAAGARQTGGKVVSTELLESKVKKAKTNLKDAGFDDLVDLRVGDAMKTLYDISEPIDLLFLDGWKDLYLPLFKMLEPLFHSGTLIYADNMDMEETQSYAQFVSNNEAKYDSLLLNNGKAFLTRVL